MLLSSFCRYPPSRRLMATFSSKSKYVKWEPWEDTLLKDYVANNGKRWSDLVRHCLPHRTGNSCLYRYKHISDSTLKKGPLTPSERDKLRQGVNELGLGNWTMISKLYLPHRTPAQLYNVWTSTCDPQLVKQQRWSTEEDNLLLDGIKQHGMNQWTKIKNSHLPHRSRQQIQYRYNNHLDPRIRHTPWTTEEADILLRRTILFGTDDWNKVSEGLEGRTPEQCRLYYIRHVDPSRTKRNTPWTENDTLLFWELVEIYDGKWKIISKQLGRTEEECIALFKAAQQRELKLLHSKHDTEQHPEETRSQWKRRIGALMSQYYQQYYYTAQPSMDVNRMNNSNNDSNNMDKLLDKNSDAQTKQHNTTEKASNKKTNNGSKGRTWTKEESNLLDQLVEKYGMDWTTIAQHHPTKSTSQCRSRYYNVLRYRQDPTYLHDQPLSKIEKELVLHGVDLFGHDWVAITKTFLPRRKPHQCMRWYFANFEGTNTGGDDDKGTTPMDSTLMDHRPIRKGRWTDEENKQLEFIMEHYYNNNDDKNNIRYDWRKIARFINTGRTPSQCKLHWFSVLRYDDSKKGSWTWDERLRLVELVQKHQMADYSKEEMWKRVATDLKTGRSPFSCRSKYNYMEKTNSLFRS
ncbi:uncharacterized protein BX664DRAFT_319019 [Halteromyces radiatus]|uniref:uncharacterized protein n=1 Tax=Halteromyces radiatus TaxID=101107 RepID=UPI002220121E|nr:uncharacterized protein BX664DRAFT_319019 [Halteromyces radiatus]KAI8098556.1 hypothetical protein BX664DRAFT_319019 [Halteromyces radiatus]